MSNHDLIAGFGGQGILFAGKFIAYEGLIEDKEVSWLPSYGPEMRGGTANCSVIMSRRARSAPPSSTIPTDADRHEPARPWTSTRTRVQFPAA